MLLMLRFPTLQAVWLPQPGRKHLGSNVVPGVKCHHPPSQWLALVGLRKEAVLHELRRAVYPRVVSFAE